MGQNYGAEADVSNIGAPLELDGQSPKGFHSIQILKDIFPWPFGDCRCQSGLLLTSVATRLVVVQKAARHLPVVCASRP
jgi:hypothetical protein